MVKIVFSSQYLRSHGSDSHSCLFTYRPTIKGLERKKFWRPTIEKVRVDFHSSQELWVASEINKIEGDRSD